MGDKWAKPYRTHHTSHVTRHTSQKTNKMEKILFAISIICFAAIASSCERTVTLDLPEHESKLVVNSIFSNDSIWKLSVSQSTGILDNDDFGFMDNAEVTIYQDGNFLETLSLETIETTTYDYTTGQEEIEEIPFYTSENVATSNHEYSVEVAVNGFETASATATLPTPVNISEVTVENLFADVEEGYQQQEGSLSITFDDPEGENFYELKVWAAFEYTYSDYIFNDSINDYIAQEVTEEVFYNIYLETNDVALSNDANKSGQSILFTDEFFEGDTKTLALQTYDAIPLDGSIVVELRSISKEVYLYNSSYNNQRWSRDDPFSEPIFVYSNIENGFGIFGAYHTTFFEHAP